MLKAAESEHLNYLDPLDDKCDAAKLNSFFIQARKEAFQQKKWKKKNKPERLPREILFVTHWFPREPDRPMVFPIITQSYEKIVTVTCEAMPHEC